jgi:shikimate dehydrogenase
VVGSPIAHSRSPDLHRAAYAELGLDWTYDRFELTADGLADFVAGLDGSWRGLSLTMPLKEAVLDLGQVDDIAREAGSGNTLIFDEDARRVYNTDVGGLTWAVRRAVPGAAVARATILGSGATARSALLSVVEMGAREVTVLARTPAKATPLEVLAADHGLRLEVRPWSAAVPAADLLISTVAAGAADGRAEAAGQTAPVVLDAIYAPWPTALAKAAADAGATVVGGLDLLVGQALLQIELMTGRTVSGDVLYAALANTA